MSGYTLKQLRELARDQGLRISGTKAQLLSRLGFDNPLLNLSVDELIEMDEVNDWDFWAQKAKHDYGLPLELFYVDEYEAQEGPGPIEQYIEMKEWYKYPNNLLKWAVNNRRWDYIPVALDRGAKDTQGVALNSAADIGDLEILQYLIRQIPTYTKQNFIIAQRLASLKGHTNIVDFLTPYTQ